jgi:branched-chain amino acid transport system substrate-binding protein
MYVLLPLVALLLWLPDAATAREREKALGAKAAVLLDLTGGQASLGRPAMNGFVLALQESNFQDQINIFVALLDTKSDPTTALSTAKRVLPDVSVAAGFTDNDAVLLTGPFFQDAHIPFLTVGATDPALPEMIGNRIFLTPFGDNTQAAAAAEFAIKEFGSTVAIIFDSTAQYSRTLPRYFRTRFEDLGGLVEINTAYNGGCDLSLLGEQIKALSPQPAFVYLAGLPDCIGDVIASLRTVGVHQPIIGGDGLDTPNLFGENGDISNDVWYTTHAWLSAETGTPVAKQFIAAYKEAYGLPPEDAFAALGYDAANLLLQVVQQVKKIRRRDILDALEQTQDFQGVTGTISYSKNNHVPKKTVWIIRLTEGQRSLAAALIPDVVPPPLLSPD